MVIHTEGPNWVLHRQRETLTHSALNGLSPSNHKPLPTSPGKLCWKRKQKGCKSQRWMLARKLSQSSGADAPVNSWRLWQLGQGLLRLEPDKTPGWRRGNGAKSHPWPRSYLQLMPGRKGEISFLQCSVPGYINHGPGKGQSSGVVGQWKSESRFIWVFFAFFFCYCCSVLFGGSGDEGV